MKITKVVGTIAKEFKIYRLKGELNRLEIKLIIPDRFASSDPDYQHKIKAKIGIVKESLTRLGVYDFE